MTLSAFQTRLSQLDVAKVASNSVNATKETIADLNAEQMFKGLRSDGKAITPGYSSLTIEIKRSKGQPTDRVTLYDRGDFARGIYAAVQGLKLEIGSRDSKSAKLERKYGKVFGLSGKYNNEYIRETLKPKFVSEIKNILKTT